MGRRVELAQHFRPGQANGRRHATELGVQTGADGADAVELVGRALRDRGLAVFTIDQVTHRDHGLRLIAHVLPGGLGQLAQVQVVDGLQPIRDEAALALDHAEHRAAQPAALHARHRRAGRQQRRAQLARLQRAQ
ncbi:hypothetical protein D9M68_921290 [compost metagenome]